MEKKKIVLLSAFYEPYATGAEQQPRQIIKKLGNKYDITLIAARLDKKLPRVENHPDFTYIRVGLGNQKLDKILYPLLAALKCGQIKPDIAHANLESYAGVALALVKFICPKAKRILTLQSGNIMDSGQKRKLLISLFWRRINFSPHKITAISLFLARRSLAMGVPKEKITIIPNGVDFSEIPRDAQTIKNRVLFGGRLSWEKGAKYMFLAWPKVLASVPDAKLVQIGDGGMKTEILKLIKELNIGESVVLKSTLPHKDAIKEIKQAEVMVCPSLAEGLGIAFIEAQACGTPAIGTRLGGIPDVIQDKENGLLIEPEDPDAIAEAVVKLLSDKELAGRLSARGLETVKKFDWNNIIKQFDEMYQKI